MNMISNCTEASIYFDTIYRQNKFIVSDLASTRMVKLAAHLLKNEYIGWEMDVPVNGLAQMRAFGSGAVKESDLRWAFEHIAAFSSKELSEPCIRPWSQALVYQVTFCDDFRVKPKQIGFVSAGGEDDDSVASSGMPLYFSTQFAELVEALREDGACFRYYVSGSTDAEREKCRCDVMASWTSHRIDPESYLGTPVRAKAVLLLPREPSLRIRAAVDSVVPGARLTFRGSLGQGEHLGEGRGHLCYSDHAADARTMPDYAARVLAMEPCITNEIVMGIHCIEKEPKPLPATHSEPEETGGVVVGQALDSSGLTRNVKLTAADLKRHWQIVGQTGTGKSTLLAGSILNAVREGYGLTFFDPHGSTIDLILKSLPEQYASRVRVIRLGDEDNPVPLNIWSSADPEAEERTINDLNLLFADIFDPRREGILGPRWERWFSVFASAAIAIFGRQASFESIVFLSQGRTNMRKAYDRLKWSCPALAETIQEEFGKISESDFSNLIGWAICKMQRLTSVPQLRKTLGAGANALRFEELLESDTVTLIDLASPVLGAHASRIIGTLILLQLWNAAMARKDRDRTHLVFIDEAHLFQTNPLPQMLAEGRKFGLGLILAHQHCGQLTQELLDALEANSASFSAFRLSVKDAVRAACRFNDDTLSSGLCGLNAFNAVTTLSVNGKQSDPFTLMISKLTPQENGAEIAEQIERESRKCLVEPYRRYHALSRDEMRLCLDRTEEESWQDDGELDMLDEEEPLIPPVPPVPPAPPVPNWLERWNRYKSGHDAPKQAAS